MKLSVKAKVANGLVICLLLPRVADTAVAVLDLKDGLSSFSADDDFDIALGPGNLAIAKVETSELAADPSGGDPSGGNPVLCDPSGVPAIHVNAPSTLVTSEEGGVDSFEVYMDPPPSSTQYLYLTTFDESGGDPSGGDPSGGDPSGGDPSGGAVPEALPVQEKIAIEAGSCALQTIWVVGQNDGRVDGDAQFTIEIKDEFNSLYASVDGVNLDNDQNPLVTVEVFGPQTMAEGQEGQFTVRVANLSENDQAGGRLSIEASSGITILSYVASLISGEAFQGVANVTPGVLTFDGLELLGQDVLILSVNTQLSSGSPSGEQIIARYSNAEQTNDDNDSVHIARP